MWYDYLFEVIDEDSDLCGDRFFVEIEFAEGERAATHYDEAVSILCDELNIACDEDHISYIGFYTSDEAEELGYDTF